MMYVMYLIERPDLLLDCGERRVHAQLLACRHQPQRVSCTLLCQQLREPVAVDATVVLRQQCLHELTRCGFAQRPDRETDWHRRAGAQLLVAITAIDRADDHAHSHGQ